ncbi:MAG: hypothetical protein AAB403_12255 [Planctomycetota bacterium]
MPIKWILLCASLLILPISVLGQTVRDQLEGWGPFRFSMSKTEAIAAARPDAVIAQEVVIYDVDIDGQLFWAGLDFTPDLSAIRQIRLAPGGWARKSRLPPRENVLQQTCLERVEPFQKKLTSKYGQPDGPFIDSKDGAFTTRRYFYRFGDGNQIVVESTYAPPGHGDGKNDHFCTQQIRYIALRAVPKATF